jgi:hypothetical protein
MNSQSPENPTTGCFLIRILVASYGFNEDLHLKKKVFFEEDSNELLSGEGRFFNEKYVQL